MPFLGVDIIPAAITIFWIWMLVDCFTNTRIRGGSKIFWLLLIFFTHIVGALIYFFMACTQRNPITAFTYYYQVIANFVKQSGPQQPQQAPPPPSYHNYQQGYHAQQPYQVEGQQQPAAYRQQEQPLYTPPKAEYEEPLTITYPEMPPQKQQ